MLLYKNIFYLFIVYFLIYIHFMKNISFCHYIKFDIMKSHALASILKDFFFLFYESFFISKAKIHLKKQNSHGL